MTKIGIVGGAGFTAGELLRLLVNHPHAEIVAVHSNSKKGLPVTSVHKDLLGDIDLNFQSGDLPAVEILFMCLGHNKSREFLDNHQLPDTTSIIDLSQDFRLGAPQNEFIYGLPELNRKKIKGASKVANPGCFATAIELALLPLASKSLLQDEIHVHAITGSTGAGVHPVPTTHFSWRQNNLSVYKAFEHQHLREIRQSLELAGNQVLPHINFIPVRGNFTKGIFCTVYTKLNGSLEEYLKLYASYYQDHPFTQLSEDPISLKEVINTNKCFLHLEYHKGRLLVTSIIDNLIKGASGQAMQNMNLMCQYPEETGLRLKATGF